MSLSKIFVNNQDTGFEETITKKVTGEFVNLYNKNSNECVLNKYIGTQGGLNNETGSIVSQLIPIKPNTIYAYSYMGEGSLGNFYFRFVASDGITQLKPLDPSKLLEIDYTGTGPSKLLKSPADAYYAQFTVKFVDGLDIRENIQLIETYILPDKYFNYETFVGFDTLTPNLKETINKKANLKVVRGVNLYDKTKNLHKYINTVHGNISNDPEWECSDLIEVTPNTVYYLYRGTINGGGTEIRGLERDKETYHKVISYYNPDFIPDSYQLRGSDNVATLSAAFITPPDVYYIQFNVKTSVSDYSDITQLELGNSYTGYHSFTSKIAVPFEELPQQIEDGLNEIEELKKEIHNADSIDYITVKTSDKIGVFSTSYMNGYSMKNHHHLNNLSMFCDFLFYNYGMSGADELENLDALNQNKLWLGDVYPNEWNITYGLVMHGANSGALESASSDTVYENSKKLANAIKALGGIPIFSTEFRLNNIYYRGVYRLCQEEGYMFMDWGKQAYLLSQKSNIFPPFWENGHPATRTGWVITNGMMPYLQSLPRPKKCIKLFRVRDGIDTTNLQNLIYDDYYSRAQRFVELTCGQIGLSTATEKYFDRLNENLTTYVNIKDEYQQIQSKQSVNFGEFALMHIVTNFDRTSLTYSKLKYRGSGITSIYIKKNINISNPLPSKRYYSFGIVSGANLLTVGQTITISGITRYDGTDLNREYTIQGIVNNMLVTNTTSSPSQGWSNGKTSGIDNPSINVSGVVLSGSYDYPSSDYMERYRNPLGEWIDITSDLVIDGDIFEIELSKYLCQCMDYDSISILCKGTNIQISDINVETSGNETKNIIKKNLCEYKDGISIITDNLFDDTTSWSNIQNLQTYDYNSIVSISDPSKHDVLPYGISTVKILNLGDFTKQNIIQENILPLDNVNTIKIQVRVIARYFPKYVNNDTEWETSEITEQSFDVARLAISIGSRSYDTNPLRIGELNIGAFWGYFIFDAYIGEGDASYVKLECIDKKIQIAKFEMVKI